MSTNGIIPNNLFGISYNSAQPLTYSQNDYSQLGTTLHLENTFPANNTGLVMYQPTYTYPTTLTYALYEVEYKLSMYTKPKSLVFACANITAPEIAIMNAADKAGMKYIQILSIKELGQGEILLTSTEKLKDIIL